MSLEKKIVESGLLTESDVLEAKQVAVSSGKSFWIELLRLKKVSERALIVFFSNSLKIPFVELYNYKINPHILSLLDEETLRKYMMIPIYKIDDVLGLAMVNPGDVIAIDEVANRLGCMVEPLLCSLNDMRYALDRYYGSEEIVGRLSEFVEAAYTPVQEVKTETRFEQRVMANLMVEIKIVSEHIRNLLEGVHLSAKAVNISAGGMLLLFDLTYFIPNGTLVELNILNDRSGDFERIFGGSDDITLSGKIVSFQGMDETSYRIGISFTDVSEDIKENIKKFAEAKGSGR